MPPLMSSPESLSAWAMPLCSAAARPTPAVGHVRSSVASLCSSAGSALTRIVFRHRTTGAFTAAFSSANGTCNTIGPR